nr:penicillin acylase family protein [Pseudomonas sp. KNUC1026]
MLRLLTAATLLAATPAYALQAASTGLEAEIRWTSEGIPHIEAGDEQGLGYGVGYAYARDNACLLEDEVLTARGERARYLGAQGQSSAQLDNVSSDLFYRWLNTDAAVQAFWARQPAPVQALIDGYVVGFNQYLASQQSYHCHGQAWVEPLVREDLVRLARRLLVEGGVGRFAEAMLNAAPPAAGTPVAGTPVAGTPVASISDPMHGFASERGSNAIAVGGERTENGKGRLLANPHFPWAGAMRFWQLHLTIPGKLDVMGAALPGLPLVNIGFNQHLAWTHTVDSSAHFTLHRLQLDPADLGRYLVDGKPHTLRKVSVSIEVLGADGVLKPLEHTVYGVTSAPW